MQTYESIEELKYSLEYEDGGINILDDLNEKAMKDTRVQAMFKTSKYNSLSTFINSQDYYEFPKRSIRATVNIYHIFKPYNFRDVQIIYQDKTSMEITGKEFKYLTSTCWDKKYQPLTFAMTKGKYTGRYRLRLNSLFVPNISPFKLVKRVFILL